LDEISNVFDDNAVHYVGDIVEAIDDLFQMVINFVSHEKRQTTPTNVRAVECV
jgi:hypothetical protein